TPLLREHAVKSCIEGSNPSVSATWQYLPIRFGKYCQVAETEGLELSMQLLTACSLSRGVPSTARPRLLASNAITLARCRLGADCTAARGAAVAPLLGDRLHRLRPIEFEGLVQRAHGEFQV